MNYNTVGRSIIKYAAPIWSPNLHVTNYRKIQYTQNEALRIATGCHKMSIITHLHTEAEMLKLREHSEPLSAQYLARCLEPGNVYHFITTRVTLKKQMKETPWLQTTQPTSGGAVTVVSSCCANCVEPPPRPQQWGPDLPFFGHAGHADPLDGWRCCSQKRVMSRPIQVRQL